MRALVTGGAGFIGSNLVDALVERGDAVTVLDDLSTGRRENLDGALSAGVELVEGDVSERGVVEPLFERARPDAVFHLAAQIDVRRSVSDPGFDARVNVAGTAAMLDAASRTGAKAFVNVSTGGAIYGEGDGRELPLDEGADVRPEAPYGQSKLAGEGYVEYFRRAGLPAVSLRLGNVYGPRQDPLGEAGVVAIFCGRLRDGRAPTVFGDGRQTRDYVFVGDVVAAMLAACDRLLAGERLSAAINVGTGEETTVLELVDGLGRLASERSFEPEFAPPRRGEVRRIAIDPRRAESELGWRAHTTLEAGLERTLRALG